MAVASSPDQNLAWPASASPIYFGAARVDSGIPSDLVSIHRNGTFTIGENANNNAWRTTVSKQPLGNNVSALAAAAGLLSGPVNADPFEDFVIQTPTHFEVLSSNGNGSWTLLQSLPYSGTIDVANYPMTNPISTLLGTDLIADFVFPLAQSNSIAILSGKSDGYLSSPLILPSGGTTPIMVAAANMLAGPSIDLAVGHADGTVTFLEGQTDQSFILRTDLTLPSVVRAMRAMRSSDLDGDGVYEVTIVGGSQAVQLRSAADPLPSPPLRNGNFDQGLAGWTVNSVGQPGNATPGNVNALSGAAQFSENQSFLTSLSQSFIVPLNPQSVQFELVALGLEATLSGSVPDAFEVSLLDSSHQSLVPTHASRSTAFVNFAPGGGYRAAPGVARNGSLITLDISSLTPGTLANLVFDLIGNPVAASASGNRSTATIDRVRISPDVIRNDSFSVTALPGPFLDARDLAIADVDGDGRSDTLITDLGTNQIVVLNALAPTAAIPIAWSRELIALPAGFPPERLAVGNFTAGDNIADIAVLNSSGNIVRSPLVADTTVPTVQLQSPSDSVTIGATDSAADIFGTVTLQFSEAMFVATPSTPGSINQLAAYRVYHLGPNNVDNGGLGDDVSFAVTSVQYDAVNHRVQLQLDNAALSNAAIAAGSLYKIVVAGASPTIGVRDIAGNRIDGGQDFVATVALNRTPTLSPLSDTSIDEGGQLTLSQLWSHYSLNRVFDAIVDWGDNSPPTTIAGDNAFPTEAFSANHTYVNDSTYTLLFRIMEGAVEVARSTATVSVRNAAPTISSLPAISGNEGQSIAYTFSAIDPGTADSLVTHIDWGDGTTSTLSPTSQSGTTRTFTVAHTFPDDGSYTVRIRVADEMADVSSVVTATITSVAPSFDVGDATAVVGIPFTLGPIEISDPGFSSVANKSLETLTATVNWGDGSPPEPILLAHFTPGNVGIPTTASLTAGHTFATAGTFTITVSVADDDGATTVRSLSVIVSRVSTPDVWLPVLNFDRDGYGNFLAAGATVSEQWTNWGVHISSTSTRHPPMIFSSTRPTGDDFDLGSPNAAFGGPGIGSAGASGPTVNKVDLKNVLILSEDRDSTDPDDNAAGGTLVFDFDHDVMIDDVKLLDIDAHETATLKWSDRNGNLIGQNVVTGVGTGNGLHVAAIKARSVARLTVALSGSGAIAEIIFCRNLLPSSSIQIVGGPSSKEGSPYELALKANGNAVDQWIVNWGNGTYTTYPGTATTASQTFPDGSASFSIIAYGLSGSHHVYASGELAILIENVVPTLTVSGPTTVDVDKIYTLNLSKSDPGTDTIKGWLIDWGDGSAFQTVAGNPASVTHHYARRGTYDVIAHAYDEDYTGSFNPFATEWVSNTLQVTVQGDDSQCLPNIDFERTANGSSLTGGTRITNQFASLGLTISTLNASHPAMIFDTASPTGGDTDLGTPNKMYGGPGIGSGGASNKQPQRNVLIISEDNNSANPDDNAQGGTIVFSYSNRTKIAEIHLLDIDEPGTVIKLFGPANTLIKTVNVSKGGDNSFQVVKLDATNVLRMEVVLAGSGAIAAVINCLGGPNIGPPNTKYFVADTNDRIYRYSQMSAGVGTFSVQTSVNARGIATNRDSNPLWVVSEEGTNDKVYVYDSSAETLLGSWTLTGIRSPQGITTNGRDLWIVDSATKRVSRFDNAASRRSGSVAASKSFALHSHNSSPTDLVTDGKYIYVVDTACDSVFVYNLAGGLVNRWKLPSANADPTGITINTRESNGIYVLDGVDRRVYRYANRRTSANNVTQAIASNFALSSGNNAPQGIADPGGHTQIGTVVNDGFETANTTIDWTFDATAGQKIYVNFQSMTSQRMNSQLIDPQGNILYTRAGLFRANEHDSGPIAITASGTYTLRLTSAETPSFQFKIWDVPAADVQNVVLRQTMNGAIEAPGAEDHWNFSATANQRFYFDTTSLTTPSLASVRVDIYAPNGSIVFSRNDFRTNQLDGSFTTTIAGNYRAVVKADAGGSHQPSYSFNLTVIPADDEQTIGFREVRSGAIESPGARDRWLFNASANQNIFIDFNSLTAGEFQWTLLAPNGSVVDVARFSRASGLDKELILPAQSGTYTLIAQSGFDSAALNTYEFIIWDVPTNVPQVALLNTLIAGNIVPGQEQTYLVDGIAGTEVLFDVIANGQGVSNRLGFTMTRPNGTVLLLRNLDDTLVTLPETGTYRVTVTPWDTNFKDTRNDYAFRIQDRATPVKGALDNIGTEFRLGFPRNGREVFDSAFPTFSLSITSAVATSGTVEVPGLNWYTSYEVTPGQTTTIVLPSQVELYDSDVITNKGIRVTALDEIAVYGLNQMRRSTDGFTALPTDVLAREYINLGYPNTANLVLGGGTHLAIVGAVDDTTVTITPTSTVGTRTAGVPYTISLDAGQTYTLHISTVPDADLTGTIITSDKPIAVFGGNTAANVPAASFAADHLIEQLPPTHTWGTEFYTSPLALRTRGDTFRILAQADNTEVRINGTLVATLARGGFHETILLNASQIVTSLPTLVAQYSHSSEYDGVISDPFMVLIPPRQQYQRDYTLSTPSSGINTNFANVVIERAAVGTVLHNNTPITASQFTSIAGTDLSYATLPISIGSHRFISDVPFTVSIYGFDVFDSYGYYGGMQLAPLQQINSLALTPAAATLGLGTQHTVSALVRDQSGVGVRGVRVSFTVEGISGRQVVDAVSNNSGIATFTLSSSNIGLDTITASAVGLQQTATVQWQSAAPTLTLTSPAPNSNLTIGAHILSGQALPGIPTGSIAEVLVNGKRVDAVDPSGQFFAPIDVLSGSQTVVVTAVDYLGQRVTRELTLIGVADPVSLSNPGQLADVTASTSVRFAGTTYHRSQRKLWADMQVSNEGSQRLDPTLVARFDRLPTGATSIANADAQSTDDNKPLYFFDTEIPANGLAPGNASQSTPVAFGNPNEDRFYPEITVLNRGNRPPRFASIPSTQIGVGSSYRYTAVAIDPDSLSNVQTITYRLIAAPDGMSIDAASGLVAWSPTSNEVGAHQLSIEASDGRGGTAIQTFSISVLSALPNRPPIFTSAPNLGGSPGALYRYNATARDLDGDNLSFSLTTGPAGATMTSEGRLEWSNPIAGVHPVEITVSDGRGGSASQRYSLVIGSGNVTLVPTIVSQPPVLAYPGNVYQYSVAAVNSFASTLTYSLLNAPSGMNIDGDTGVIQWTPTAAQLGASPLVQIEVRNAAGGVASQSYSVSVIAQQPAAPPRFLSSPLTVATVSSGYSYDADAVSSLGSQPGNNSSSLTYSLLNSPAGLAIDSANGLLTWIPGPTDLGQQRILIAATDNSTGLRAFQQFYLSVRNLNTAPTFVSTPITSIDVGGYYRYQAVATDTDDGLRYSLVTLPNTNSPAMQIDPISGSITWQPRLSDVASYPITVRATDDRGAIAEQSFTLTVMPDTRPPDVSIILSEAIIHRGDTAIAAVGATDNIGVVSYSLKVNGQPVQLDSDRRYTFANAVSGLYHLEARAIDASGNVGTANKKLRVLNPDDTTPPQIIIDPSLPGSVVTYVTALTGSVIGSDLEYYDVAYSLAGADQWTTFFSSSSQVTNSSLATFDPTRLTNDIYEIRVTAQDISGNQAIETFELSLEGQAKIGNFRLSLIDLAIPVAGIPITIGRSYDTLDAAYSSDFGYGWTMNIATPRIRESVRVSPSEAAGAGPLVANPFRMGTRVYMNTPDGRRVGFTFTPEVSAGLLGAVWTPKFTADRGVDYQLQVESTSLSQNSDGTFGLYLLGLPYNPDTYTLISKDQMRYTYKQFADMQLQSISDRNNVQLTFSQTGIRSSLGPEILWTRDANGRITKITDPDGREILYGYDSTGDLISVANQSGEVVQISYMTSPLHFLQSITDARGIRVQEVTYNSENRVSAVSDASGSSIARAYDLENQLEIVGDRIGNETQVHFDERGNITSTTDPRGGTVTAIYNNQDRPITIIDQRGNETRYEYDGRNNITRQTDPTGAVWSTSYTARNDILSKTDPLGRTTLFTYDTNGNRTSIVDAAGAITTMEIDSVGRTTKLIDAKGKIRQYSYTSHSNPTRITHPDGTFQSFQYNGRAELVEVTNELDNRVSITRDNSGREIARTDALGNTTRLVYQDGLIKQFIDALGRTTTYEYDARGLVIREINALGGVRSTDYDANGRIVSSTDENGNRQRWEYDANGNPVKQINAFGFATQNVFDRANNLISEIDSSGAITSYTYDALNREVGMTYPDGSIVQTQYDLVGNVVSTTGPRGEQTRFQYDPVNQLIHTTDPMGGVYHRTWDLIGNLVSQTDPRGNTVTFRYDDRNRRTHSLDARGFAVRFEYDAASRLTKTIDQLNSETSFLYDARGLLTSVSKADGGVQAFEYDAVGNTTKEIDPLGRTTVHQYDVLNRLVITIDPRGHSTVFGFDPAGNLTRLTDPSGNVTQWTFDALNRVTHRTDPLGGVERFIYDNVTLACGCVSANGRGHLSEYVDKNGRQTIFKYDSRNRNTEVIYRDVTGTEVDRIIKSYDPSSNLASIVDNDSQLQFTYDLNSRLVTTSNLGTPNVRSVTLSNTWDAAGNRVGITDSDGVSMLSTYDSRNLLSGRTWTTSNSSTGPLATAKVDFAYNGRGQLISTERFSNAAGVNRVSKTNRNYDTVGRTNVISHLSALDAVLAEFDTDWSIADELVAWTNNGHRTSYQYDPTGQLISADHTGPLLVDETYQYDASGNRTGTGKTLGTNNRLLADERFDYSYDPQGNTTSKLERVNGKRQIFVYDHENRLTHTETRSATGTVLSSVDYRYDALGRRIARTVDVDGAGSTPAFVETFVYDGDNIWLDADGSGTVTARYLHGDLVDEPLARYRPAQGLAWYLTDHLGSVRAIADGNGSIVDTLTYDSFGNIVLETNIAWGDRVKFTGREWDPVANLYYYRSRMYDPASGRFMSTDQIGFAAGDANLYRYVGNMPGAYRDPSGNVAAAEYGTSLNNLSRVGIAAVQGLSGFTFGYSCGYLQATTLLGLQGAEAEFHAKRLGLLVGSVDFAAGMVLDLKGSIGAKVVGVGLFAAGAMALSLGEALASSPVRSSSGGDQTEMLGGSPAAIASTLCTTVSIVGGIAVGRLAGKAAGRVGSKAAGKDACPECVVENTGVAVIGTGGLNLWKNGSEQALNAKGWSDGDYFLFFTKQKTTKADWSINASLLRKAMREGRPIFDSYIDETGNLIKAEGFLNMERNLLLNRGWKFNPSTGAWHPPTGI